MDKNSSGCSSREIYFLHLIAMFPSFATIESWKIVYHNKLSFLIFTVNHITTRQEKLAKMLLKEINYNATSNIRERELIQYSF